MINSYNDFIIEEVKVEISTLLSNKKERLAHSLQVFTNATQLFSSNEELSSCDSSFQTNCLVAALLHDVGYAENLSVNNFHPVDGFLYATKFSYEPSICNTILYHTYSDFFAELLGDNKLSVFYQQKKLDSQTIKMIEIVTFCDLHASSSGKFCSIDERINSIRTRYGEDSIQLNHILYVSDQVSHLTRKLSFK